MSSSSCALCGCVPTEQVTCPNRSATALTCSNLRTRVQIVTMRPMPAAPARSTTVSVSPAKSGKSRWQWLSTSISQSLNHNYQRGLKQPSKPQRRFMCVICACWDLDLLRAFDNGISDQLSSAPDSSVAITTEKVAGTLRCGTCKRLWFVVDQLRGRSGALG